MDLASPVQFVKGIGPHKAAELSAAGIHTVEDLLLHLPMRYEDRTQFVRIADLRAGMKVAVTGTITVAGLRRARRMTLYEVRIDDGTGRLKALWFNQPFLKESLARGARVALFGDVQPDSFGGRQLMMSSPQHEVLEDDGAAVHTGRVVPIYEKLGPLTGKMLRRTLTQIAPPASRTAAETLPEDVRNRLGVVGRGEALRRVHVPEEADPLDALNAFRSAGHRRLILEELFLFQLGLALKQERRRERPKRAAFTVTDATREAVKRILPFHLTGAQKRVLREIAADLQCPHPMNRLVQGDVGSGKTVVALLAMVVVLENGAQAAFMAPTEILAEQHFLTLRRLLARCPYRLEIFTSAMKGAERAKAAARLAAGETHIAVGTHALIQEGVRFKHLGLAVVDEQHRFGVLQRDELRRKGLDVDVLVMTATPIPRTLALTAYGDLDVSLLDERPPGRTPIATRHRPASDRRAIVETVRAAVAEGRQAYVVYPLVEESEKLEDVRAATSMAEEWAKALPAVRVGLLHGRMKTAEKEAVMRAFHRREVQVLVSTTVIEVGVDVPNATLMVVEHAERFGLSQLHQMRGRVGRGTAASACLLVTHGRLSDEARERIETMVRTEDGFAIAEKDLELRGPGDFFGTRQSGLPLLRVADLMRDRDLLEEARREAFALVQRGAAGTGPLRVLLGEGGWERRFGLARVG
jgi:ATP-dependent DNA helicase RecG